MRAQTRVITKLRNIIYVAQLFFNKCPFMFLNIFCHTIFNRKRPCQNFFDMAS